MKKIFIATFTFTAVASLIYLASCTPKKAATKTACASTPTYTADIKTIFEASCMPCHSAEKHKHGIDLSNYETSKESAKGKNFLGAIKHEAGYDAMPPPPEPPLQDNKRLSDATIEKISCWIENGMPQ